MALICVKLLLVFLARLFIHVLFSAIHTYCEYLLVDNEYHRYFIHNSLFRCKINKFISFLSEKEWKTCE